MKIIKFILFSLLIIGNTSCSKDDDNVESLDITGEWTMTDGLIVPGSMNLDIGMGSPVHVEYSGSFINIEESNRLHFEEDNTFSSITGNLSLEMRLIIMGTAQTDSFEGSDLFGQGTYEVHGRELKIRNENGTTIKYYIDHLDENTLKLSSNVKDMNTGQPNPMLESMNMVIKMTLKKV